MNPQFLPILSAILVVLVLLVFMFILLTRYTKVGPNQVLIVSGRRIQLPDGRILGFRIVKGGGTFVLPLIERVDTLSLEVLNVEIRNVRLSAASGNAVQMDCAAQVKIKSDDASIVTAAEHFLSKTQAEIKFVLQAVLDRHLNNAFADSNGEKVIQNPVAFAATVQTASAVDFGKMGLDIINVAIRNARIA